MCSGKIQEVTESIKETVYKSIQEFFKIRMKGSAFKIPFESADDISEAIIDWINNDFNYTLESAVQDIDNRMDEIIKITTRAIKDSYDDCLNNFYENNPYE